MKKPLIFLLGVLIGAALLYLYLWYQVFNSFQAAWCQMYVGKMSVQQTERCAELAK